MSRIRFIGLAAIPIFAVYACDPDFEALSGASGAGGGGSGGDGGRSGGAGISASSGTAPVAGSGSTGGAGAPSELGGMGGEPPTVGGEGGVPATAGTAGGGGTVAGTAGTGGNPPIGGQGGSAPWPVCSGPGNACGFRAGVPVTTAAVTVTAPRLIQEDFTIEAWINTATSRMGLQPFEGTPIVAADKSGQNYDFELAILNNKLVMNIGTPEFFITSASDVATGQWVHVAATRNMLTGVFEIYVNGVREATGTANMFPLNTEALLAIGAVGRRVGSFMDGRIDEVKLWTTVRTEAEIQAGMHEVPDESEPGLVGYYRCDELIGAALLDNSPSRNHATITGTDLLVPSDAPLCESAGGNGGAGGEGGAEGGEGGSGGTAGRGGTSGGGGNAGRGGTSGGGGNAGRGGSL